MGKLIYTTLSVVGVLVVVLGGFVLYGHAARAFQGGVVCGALILWCIGKAIQAWEQYIWDNRKSPGVRWDD